LLISREGQLVALTLKVESSGAAELVEVEAAVEEDEAASSALTPPRKRVAADRAAVINLYFMIAELAEIGGWRKNRLGGRGISKGNERRR
jgi:hypothetical protein